jgi:hypothetical protein
MRAWEPSSPLEAKGVYLLTSRPVCDPVEGVVDSAALGSPRALVAQGVPSRAHSLAGARGWEDAKDWIQAIISQELQARSSP